MGNRFPVSTKKRGPFGNSELPNKLKQLIEGLVQRNMLMAELNSGGDVPTNATGPSKCYRNCNRELLIERYARFRDSLRWRALR